MTVSAFSKLELGPYRFTGDLLHGRPVVETIMLPAGTTLNYAYGPNVPGYGGSFHGGHDYGASVRGFAGDPIHHIGPSGRVARIDVDGIGRGVGNGNTLVIFTDYPWVLLYLHGRDDPREHGWDVGDRVERGQFLMPMGTTGNSTGAHLHFGLWYVTDVSQWPEHDGPGSALRSQNTDPAPYFVETLSPSAPSPTDGWVEPKEVFSQEEVEIGAALGYHDVGTKVGSAPGDLDARAKIWDDGQGLIRTFEFSERL